MIAAARRRLRDQGGFTLIELMVGMVLSLGVFFGLYAVFDAVSRGSTRVTARIEANKLARPVMAKLIDDLHSTCVAPNVAPVLAGSTGTSISFLNRTGSAVSLTPVKRTVSLVSGTLREAVYPAVSGAAPTWTFSSTATSNRQLLTPVQQASLGAPPVTVPIFRYYAFVNGQISPTPLATPLSATDAARATQVTVSFAVPPRRTTTPDPEGTISLSDSVLFRFDPPGESAAQANLPCA